MLNTLGIGQERESWNKLLEFLKGPSKFFEQNIEDRETLVTFMTFIIRLAAVIDFAVNLLMKQNSTGGNATVLIAVILLAKPLAYLAIILSGALLNFIVKIFSKKDDIKAAHRIVAYGSVVSLIPSIPANGVTSSIISIGIGILSMILLTLVDTIGISKQYKLSKLFSFIIVISPLIIIAIIIGLIIFLIN